MRETESEREIDKMKELVHNEWCHGFIYNEWCHGLIYNGISSVLTFHFDSL